MHPDAEIWKERYRLEIDHYLGRGPFPLVRQFENLLPSSGVALEAACGVSPLSRFILEHGMSLVGLDISMEALSAAKRRTTGPGFSCAIMDLMDPWLPDEYFEAIFNFYFLSRPLLDRYRTTLKPGGLLFCEIFVWSDDAGNNMRNYLQPGELEGRFGDWQLIFRDEITKAGRNPGWPPRKAIQLVVRKPR